MSSGGKRKKEKRATDGWLVSYGDMITTLLCFFIVLTALADDQSGVNLYLGTGSFRKSLQSLGVPGLTPQDKNPVELPASGTLYDGEEEDFTDADPDQRLRVLDIEQERFQRMLTELESRFPMESHPSTEGEITVDIHRPLAPSAPYLAEPEWEAVSQLLPYLHRPGYELNVIVWATTPRNTALVRAARQSSALTEWIKEKARLKPSVLRRIIPRGQSWRHKDSKRPVFSVKIVKKVEG